VSLFTRPERRAVTYQGLWGSDDYESVVNDFATFVPVFAATRLLCDAVAQTPLHAYAADGSGRLTTQPAFLVQPSPNSTRYEWFYRFAYSALVRGNSWAALAGVGRDGWPIAAEVLNPTDCSVVDDDAITSPVFTVFGQPVARDALLHVPAYPLPGKVLGLSPIKAFATTTEVGWQAVRFGRDWFRNNGTPGAVMRNTVKQTLSEPETRAVKAKFKEAVRGRDLLVHGTDWEFSAITIPAEESQFLATIKATANQVAAIYGVPPERIGGEAASSRSYANLDMDLRYLRQTAVSGWLTQFEQALDRLAPPGQFVKFNMDAGIRADTLTRMQAHEIALRTGVETLDEAREVEDKAPLSDAERQLWVSTYRPQPAQPPVTRESQMQPIVVQLPEVDARTFTTVEAPAAPAPAQIHNHVATPDVRVNVEPPQVTVEPAQVRIDAPNPYRRVNPGRRPDRRRP